MLPNESTTRSEIVTLPDQIEALVVASDRNVGRPWTSFLRTQQVNVNVVPDADRAFEETLLHRPHVLLVHDDIGPTGGVDLCVRLKANTRTHLIPVILLKEKFEAEHRLRAISAGADALFDSQTSQPEREARLWALLRSQAVLRRQERKERQKDKASKAQHMWVGSFVHDLQSSVGALSANLDYINKSMLQAGLYAQDADLEDAVRDSRAVFSQLARGFRTVVDFERMSMGRAPFRETSVDLTVLASEVARELEWHARSSGRQIVLGRVGSDVAVVGDRELLKQTLLSLVAALIRQGSTSRVTIDIERVDGHILIRIAGDAAGSESLTASERANIFEPYAVKAPKGAPVGHGLGLALAKVAVELHGGRISLDETTPVSSHETCFAVRLPLGKDVGPR